MEPLSIFFILAGAQPQRVLCFLYWSHFTNEINAQSVGYVFQWILVFIVYSPKKRRERFLIFSEPSILKSVIKAEEFYLL